MSPFPKDVWTRIADFLVQPKDLLHFRLSHKLAHEAVKASQVESVKLAQAKAPLLEAPLAKAPLASVPPTIWHILFHNNKWERVARKHDLEPILVRGANNYIFFMLVGKKENSPPQEILQAVAESLRASCPGDYFWERRIGKYIINLSHISYCEVNNRADSQELFYQKAHWVGKKVELLSLTSTKSIRLCSSKATPRFFSLYRKRLNLETPNGRIQEITITFNFIRDSWPHPEVKWFEMRLNQEYEREYREEERDLIDAEEAIFGTSDYIIQRSNKVRLR